MHSIHASEQVNEGYNEKKEIEQYVIKMGKKFESKNRYVKYCNTIYKNGLKLKFVSKAIFENLKLIVKAVCIFFLCVCVCVKFE